MANPQVKNGYVQVAYEVWEQLMRAGLSGSELAIVMAVIRKTWGWKRKEAEISLTEYGSMTAQPERTVAHSLRVLIDRNIVTRMSAGGGRGRSSTWSFNKDWETWKTLQRNAENKNSAKINSVLDCSTTLQGVAEITAKDCRVSPGNLFETQEHEPPKETSKEKKEGSKDPSLAKGRQPDPAYEAFCSEFAEHRGIPYRGSKGDFVQLAGLRTVLGCNGRGVPGNWIQAVHNYFASPLNKYTLADLCTRYDVFLASRLNEFNKPDVTGGKLNGKGLANQSRTAPGSTDFVSRTSRGEPRYIPKQRLPDL